MIVIIILYNVVWWNSIPIKIIIPSNTTIKIINYRLHALRKNGLKFINSIII